MKTILHLICFIVFIVLISCKSREKRLVGVYKTSQGDTMRLVEDNSFRIELADPDTVQHKQFKIATGRWNLEGNKLKLHMDSRSMGTYWECQPFRTGWRRLRRPRECTEGGDKLVFKKTRVKKPKYDQEEDEEGTRRKKKKKKEKDEE
jgi:hypothetical protein